MKPSQNYTKIPDFDNKNLHFKPFFDKIKKEKK